MIDVDVEFTKGVLFVRLKGVINKSNEYVAKEKIFNIIKNGGIRYLVFNTEQLDITSDVTLFDDCEKLIKQNDGKMLICCSNMKEFATSYEHVENELLALNLLTA
ncbi:MAG: hypothetical protein J6J17_01340 [Bacilli bacterium]|nr:hypothetical protein [Bacilli bacterium]